MNCPKCGGSKDKRAKQCKQCRKKEQQSTKDRTRENRYDYCFCGERKAKHAQSCRDCANKQMRKNSSSCRCGKPKSHRAKSCIDCYHKSVSHTAEKQCSGCEQVLPIESFYLHSGKTFRSRCVKCCRVEGRRRNIITKCLRYGLEKTKAIEIAELDEISCEICKKSVARFHIDHDHKSGQFRGLLCANCNSGLGLFNDDLDRLKSAISYLIGASSDATGD